MKIKTKEFFQRIKKVINRPDMILLPGQLAFFLVLAIIPTMTVITYGASILNLSIDFLYDFLAKAFSVDIANLMLSTSDATNIGLKLTVVIGVSYYLASNGAASVIVTSNTIYGVKNGSWLTRRFKAIIMSLIFVLLLTVLLIVPVFGEQIIALIKNVNLNTQITNVIVQIFTLIKGPVMWIFLFLLIKIIYILAPDRKIIAHNANYGAIFTTIAWILMTSLYSFYINNLADYSAFYGGLTSVCVLMMWFYFLAYFFVIGMSLNYQKENDELEKTGVIKTVD
ncbi:MAG: YihY/virulence factor BrkB family protein [Firmicutes bacterium]|nr:YihY/virulence factor BrkB family protein [Bacillota bacterium]